MAEWWEEEVRIVNLEETKERGLLNSRQAMKYLRMSQFTLDKIERLGRLVPYRTLGGHRRYSIRMLNEYLEASRR